MSTETAASRSTKLPLGTVPSLVGFDSRLFPRFFKLTPPSPVKERILGPWKDEDLNDEQRSYDAIPRTHEQWPPPHHMYFGFPCDKPFEYITARAKELGSTRKDWEEIAEQETVDWDNFFMACMDIMHDVIFDKCRFRYLPMFISMRAGSKEGTVGLLTIASNRDEKFVKLPKRALRAIRWAYELPTDAQPMWYYSQAYYERVAMHHAKGNDAGPK